VTVRIAVGHHVLAVARILEGVSEIDSELVEAAKRDIAAQHGIPSGRAHRLVGSTASELHADARALAKELDVLDPTERARDDGGRFAAHDDMNARLRAAAGR
jgi:hypothetical protein